MGNSSGELSIAVIDIAAASLVEVHALGSKDHQLTANKFDASDRDNKINISS